VYISLPLPLPFPQGEGGVSETLKRAILCDQEVVMQSLRLGHCLGLTVFDVIAEGPCRSTLASLQHDYKLHFQYEGKVWQEEDTFILRWHWCWRYLKRAFSTYNFVALGVDECASQFETNPTFLMVGRVYERWWQMSVWLTERLTRVLLPRLSILGCFSPFFRGGGVEKSVTNFV